MVWPMLVRLREYYGTSSFLKPTIGNAMSAYDWALFGGFPGTGFGIALGLGLAMLALFIRLWPQGEAPESHRPAPETLVLVMALLATPFTVAATARLMSGAFAERYALAMVAAIGLAVAYAVRALDDRKQLLTAAGLACVFGAHELVFWGTGGQSDVRRRAPSTLGLWQAIQAAQLDDHPVVIADGVDFLPLAFYRPPGSTPKLICLIDLEAALAYAGTDAVDRDLIALRRYADLGIVDFATFRQQQREFYLLAALGTTTWWPKRLTDDGYTLTFVSNGSRHALFLARAPALPAEK